MEYIKSLLNDARNSSVEAQKELLTEFISYAPEILHIMDQTDTHWLVPLTKRGNLKAICCLYYGASQRIHHWVEEFLDEDTGEYIPVDRYTLVDGSTFSISTDELEKLIKDFENFTEEDINVLRRLNILAGKHSLVKELHDKHHCSYFASLLAEDFYYGDERDGVFIDKEKARHYYALAGEEMPEEDDEDDNDWLDIIFATYNIKGNENTISEIVDIIDKLASKHGTPDNEFGIYVPVKYFIKQLVGSDAYQGNIISSQIDGPGNLVLKVETDSNGANALKYALRIAFPGIEVTDDYSVSW